MLSEERFEDLCSRVARYNPSRKELVARFRRDCGSLGVKKGETSMDYATHRLARLHTQMRFEQAIADEEDSFLFRLERNPYRKEGYDFYQAEPGEKREKEFLVSDARSGEDIGGVDLIVIVEGDKPILVETTLSRYRGSSAGTICRMLNPGLVARKVTPFSRLFDERDCDLIYVIPEDTFRTKSRQNSSNMARFVAFSGREVIPFYTTREKWNEEAPEIVHEAW